MKSIVPLIALTLACAACAGEAPQERARTTAVASEPAAPASRPDVTPSQTPAAVEPSPVAAESAPARPDPQRSTSARPGPPAAMTPAPAPGTQPEGRRITAAELRPLVERGDAVLVDVRGESEFAYRRAAGALHIPYREIFPRSVDLPHEKLIALYCT